MDKNNYFKDKIILKLAFFLVAGVLVTGMICCVRTPGELEQAGYQGVLLANYDVSHMEEEDFLAYRGLKVSANHEVYADVNALADALETYRKENPGLMQFYIGLHPSTEKDALQKLIKTIKKEKDKTYEILLSAPSEELLLAQTAREREAVYEATAILLSGLQDCSNAYVYYVGEEEWLIANPDNYVSEMGLNDVISDKLMCATFCDRLYAVTPESYSRLTTQLEERLERLAEVPRVYPDLSDYQIVFLGDSIMGNYEGSYSIPGVVAALSGAQTFNCGEGGVAAARTEGSDWSALRMAKGLKMPGERLTSVEGQYTAGAEAFEQAYDSNAKTVFFLEFGINDYFKQILPGDGENASLDDTYYGALRCTVEQLQKDYPQADICILAPTYVADTERRAHSLADYIAAAEAVSDDTQTAYIDMYSLVAADEETYAFYLEDECHLDADGRFIYAQILISYLDLERMLGD